MDPSEATLEYNFDDDKGSLSIMRMPNYDVYKGSVTDNLRYPWNDLRHKIKTVIFNKKVAVIPSHAFEDCDNLTEVIMTPAIAQIEEKAFARCYQLLNVNIPQHCIVANDAFLDCFTLNIAEVLKSFIPYFDFTKHSELITHIFNLLIKSKHSSKKVLPFEIIFALKHYLQNDLKDFSLIASKFLSYIYSLYKNIRIVDTYSIDNKNYWTRIEIDQKNIRTDSIDSI